MTNNRMTSPQASLRQRAEAKLPKAKAEAAPPGGGDPQRLVHELQVHQVELEMQNEELVHARTALEASTQKYTDLYDFAPVSYLTLDAKGNIREANLTAATYLGVNRAQLIGQPFSKFLDAESRSAFRAAFQASTPGEAKRTCEVTLPKVGAPPRRARLEGVLVPANSGVNGHCRMVIFDLTERKQSEAAVRAAELLYHSLVENLPQNVFRKDCDGRFTFVNQRFCDTIGRVREEVIGRTDFDLFPDALAAKYQADDQRVMESRQLYTVVEEHVTPGQGRLFMEVIKTPLVDTTGKVTGVQGIFWDVTERETAEETLRESQAGLATIFRASPAAISVNTVAAGRLIEVNDRFCEFIGQAREDLIGKSILDLKLWAKPEDRAVVVERLLKAGAIHDHETRYRRQDGELRDVLVSMELIDLAGESEPVLISMFTDITTRKQAEEAIRTLNVHLERRVEERTAALHAANKELESFSYSVSHDLRAPLRHIQGYVEMLHRTTSGKLAEKPRRYLQVITEASVEMGELIDDLLAFSRMGRAEMIETRFPLDQLVQDTLKSLEMSTQGRNITWQIAPLPPVMGDRAMIRQVLANLLGNAVKYSRPRDPAQIEIGVAGEENGRVIIFVRDNGAGFDMQYAHKLFGVFQRLHRAEDFEGTGIGLATVHRIIARHGGRVWGEGELNKGATFYFTLRKQSDE